MALDPTDENSTRGGADNWKAWSKVYSDRDLRMKLYCRDPEESTPYKSNTLVVRNINEQCTLDCITKMLSKFGKVEKSSFPRQIRPGDLPYCFVKFLDSRDAIRACNYFNGARVEGRFLQVSHYDSAAELSKIVELSEDDELKNSVEENIAGYVRQAELQAESRAAKRLSKSVFRRSEEFDECKCKSEEDDENGAKKENSICTKRYAYSIDDVGLDSESDFWDWLRGKLNFTGPLHYTHPDIAQALSMLPPTVRRQFDWLLAAFRVSDVFTVIGPHVCFPEHSYWAKEMCVIARIDYKFPFKEAWEPLHPSEIKNEKQFIKYVRAMLVKFGPLAVADRKMILFIDSLSEEMRIESRMLPDGITPILEGAASGIVVEKGVYYLVREHGHLLGRAKVRDWRTDSAVMDDSDYYTCGDSTKSRES